MHYRLHDLTDTEFQNLVVLICREWFGPALTSFAPGKDGGKDAKFVGTAHSFPSAAEPASGKFVIQAKHTSNPYASCSDYDFEEKEIKGEIPKIKRQFEAGELSHYVIFTNRRKTGGAEERIPKHISKQTGVQSVWLKGSEDLDTELSLRPQLVRASGLDVMRSPIVFVAEDIRDVVLAFDGLRVEVSSAFDSEHDFRDYPGLVEKNRTNGLRPEYSDYILEDSEPLFPQIRAFLENARNRKLKEQYHAFANELKGQLITHRARFEYFDDALEHVFGLLYERSAELLPAPRRTLAKVFLHYMYVDCDIGKKK